MGGEWKGPVSDDSEINRAQPPPTAGSVSEDLETEEVGQDRNRRDAFHRVSVAQAPATTYLAQESLHHREGSLHINEYGSVGSVRNRADHPVTTRSLGHARPVVHSLNAPGRDTVPVNQAGHKAPNAKRPKSLPSLSEG